MCLSFLSTLLEHGTPKVIRNIIINSWEFLSNEWVFSIKLIKTKIFLKYYSNFLKNVVRTHHLISDTLTKTNSGLYLSKVIFSILIIHTSVVSVLCVCVSRGCSVFRSVLRGVRSEKCEDFRSVIRPPEERRLNRQWRGMSPLSAGRVP